MSNQCNHPPPRDCPPTYGAKAGAGTASLLAKTASSAMPSSVDSYCFKTKGSVPFSPLPGSKILTNPKMSSRIGCALAQPLISSGYGKKSTTQTLHGSNSTPLKTNLAPTASPCHPANGLKQPVPLAFAAQRVVQAAPLATKTLPLNSHPGCRPNSSSTSSKNSSASKTRKSRPSHLSGT